MIVRPVLELLEREGGILSPSEAATQEIGAALVSVLQKDSSAAESLPTVILLEGDMGSGKTVLVSGIAEALGIAPSQVQSPTFTLINEYADSRGEVRLVHCDLYRLEAEEIGGTGLFELMDVPGRVTVVEWAERLRETLPGAVRLRLSRVQTQSSGNTVDSSQGGSQGYKVQTEATAPSSEPDTHRRIELVSRAK